MSTNEPMPGDSDCLIKFASRADYNHFVAQLRTQLRTYLISSCQEHKIEVGSPDYAAIEAILMDVRPRSPFFVCSLSSGFTQLSPPVLTSL
jgi:hypothetical protein